jgi:hypothetical protein
MTIRRTSAEGRRMATLRIEHVVRTFEAWKQAFDSDPVGRESGGVRGYRIAQSAGDRNHVFIDLEFDDIGAAEAFKQRLEGIWVSAGPRLGLESPSARVVDVVESSA